MHTPLFVLGDGAPSNPPPRPAPTYVVSPTTRTDVARIGSRPSGLYDTALTIARAP